MPAEIMSENPVQMLGEYPVLRELAPGQTYLAQGAGNRLVVLKRLPEDCLYEGRLHVSIKERLERIREVAHAGVANLYGVERVDGVAYEVWEYVDGTPLEEYLVEVDERGQAPDLVAVGRELVMSVEGLHKLGLVHGSLHGGNIFVTSEGLRLTHLSPLLYTDPMVDADAVVHLLLDTLNRRYTPADLPVHTLLTRAAEEGYDLARLGPLLACPPDSPLSPQRMNPRRPRRRGLRRRSVLVALLLMMLGAAVSVGVLYWLELIPRVELGEWWGRISGYWQH